jgi:L-aspartate oxidase
MISCDVLVIGAGIAGCTAALRAAELGADVVLAAKDALGESNTAWAQGGIIGLPP